MATELINSFNFQIAGNNWQPLSDIMGQEYYDHTKGYILYVNGCAYGTLGYTQRTVTPTAQDKGRELLQGAEINIAADNGDIIYLRATGAPVDIEIREVAE